MSLKSKLKSLIRVSGYDLITTETSDECLLAGNLRQLFERFDIQLVLDVGANEGQYYRFMRDQVGFEGSIVSFEPAPHLAARLVKRAAADPNWQVRSYALGSTPGRLKFNVAAETQVSSFLPFADNTKHVPITSVEEVEVETLNNIGASVFADTPIEKTFIKLDTQGFDLEVMKGADQYLRRLPCLTTEVPVIQIYEGMTPFEQHLAFVRGHGFGLAGMWPTSRDDWFRAREFDCLFVNEQMASQT